MDVGKITTTNEEKTVILKKALENGKIGKEVQNNFIALNSENTNPISDNDFAAFNVFKDVNGELSLSAEKLEALKLFDVNGDGTFSDSELSLLELSHRIGGSSFLLDVKSIDEDENGRLNREEIDSLANILKPLAKMADVKKSSEKEFLAKDKDGMTPLHLARENLLETKGILFRIGNNEELLEKVLLAKDKEEATPLHWAVRDNSITKEILAKIGNDKELLEKVLLAKDKYGSIPLHYSYSNTAKEILAKIGDDKELLEKVLLAKDERGKTYLHMDGPYSMYEDALELVLKAIGNDKELLEKVLLSRDGQGKTLLHIRVKMPISKDTRLVLDKIGDNKELLEKVLLAKDEYGNIPLHDTHFANFEVIIDKISNNKELLEKVLCAKDERGDTPLNSSSCYKNRFTPAETISILDKIDKNLLEKIKLDINSKNKNDID